MDKAGKAARDRIPCTGNAQLYRVLRRANNDTGANAGAYRRCDNKPDAGLSGCREEVLRRTGVLAPASPMITLIAIKTIKVTIINVYKLISL